MHLCFKQFVTKIFLPHWVNIALPKCVICGHLNAELEYILYPLIGLSHYYITLRYLARMRTRNFLRQFAWQNILKYGDDHDCSIIKKINYIPNIYKHAPEKSAMYKRGWVVKPLFLCWGNKKVNNIISINQHNGSQ